ncbi:hemagglutinin-neuraminidase [avian paramyxovirus 13]|uniref:Hemagglutinin-neuraminidase n=1 Tax=avian paramyxovirus 13 TaxID=2560321 RepID=A0A173M8X5_9MONO|nr:hemagglutinin-neuraminidase [Avian paramyxovirus goose/Shimane/67/2000]BAV03984.1 hemagglutinin-neuraminidase [Avian paramyxovirus goose/Shimane/67/2000]
MQPGISEVSFVNDERSERGTWRLLFRILTIVLCLTSIGIGIPALIYSKEAATSGDIDKSLEAVKTGMSTLSSKIDESINTEQKIYRQVILEAPVSQLNMESNILSAITSLSYQIDGTSNSSGCGSPMHDQDFVGGINKEIWTTDNVNLGEITLTPFLEHLNFIPAPTTGNGCTRIPSFDLGLTHWCYTHNVILSGCQDYSSSFQYIALGVLKISATGHVFLSTMRSINLDDERNRKSCSISATSIGCDIICSLVTEREVDDYNSPAATPMIHGRLDFSGKYNEVDLNVGQLFGDWSANYPGVGGGSFLNGRVWFPIYGGVKEGTPTFKENDGRYAIYTRYNDTCPDSESEQVSRAKSSYRPSYFGGKLVQQAVLSIKIDDTLGLDPVLTISNNSITLMGAESRVLQIEEKLYFYQRGTSWFPSLIMYPLTVDDKMVRFEPPTIFDQFTRPGNHPCSADSRCPNACVTGVYTDGYPIVFHNNHSIAAVYGMQLNDVTNRLNPRSAVWYGVSMSNVIRVSSSTTKAAYTTSTCFKVKKTQRVYCLSIGEIGNTLFGEFRIVPLLLEVYSEKGKSLKSSFDGWEDISINNPLRPLDNHRVDPILISNYTSSWP